MARSDQSLLGQWWFTVDRVLLTAIMMLVGIGLLMSLAASPAIAMKRGLPAYYFVVRHTAFASLGVIIILAISMLSIERMRRLCLGVFLIALALMAAVLWIGPEINGARRWIRVAGYSIQPSEFIKPSFVVLAAWLFAEAQRRSDVPAIGLAVALQVIVVSLLLLEPDIGQTLLLTVVWCALYFISGMPARLGLVLVAAAPVSAGLVYAAFPHVRDRVDRFVNPSSGDNYQIERALQAIKEGGLFGRGPGEGTVKILLPDAHTDFIFAVIAEEYGALVCLVLIGMYGFVTLRALARALQNQDPFIRNGLSGLALMFGLQALINMAVNVGLLPAKGMTLPFISYGGSSLLALSMTMGLLVALARRRPGQLRPKKSALPSVSGIGTQRQAAEAVWRV